MLKWVPPSEETILNVLRRLSAILYHMNIEEDNLARKALRDNRDFARSWAYLPVTIATNRAAAPSIFHAARTAVRR